MSELIDCRLVGLDFKWNPEDEDKGGARNSITLVANSFFYTEDQRVSGALYVTARRLQKDTEIVSAQAQFFLTFKFKAKAEPEVIKKCVSEVGAVAVWFSFLPIAESFFNSLPLNIPRLPRSLQDVDFDNFRLSPLNDASKVKLSRSPKSIKKNRKR